MNQLAQLTLMVILVRWQEMAKEIMSAVQCSVSFRLWSNLKVFLWHFQLLTKILLRAGKRRVIQGLLHI